MNKDAAKESVEREEYLRARLRRDANFDGVFFFAVKTTGIFCRPSCPSPAAKEENVLYFANLYEALEAGFRPCHRCRPDVTLPWSCTYEAGAEVVERALDLIAAGYLNYHSLEDLAGNLNISPRQLRRFFIDTLGIPPVKAARYHKSVFARKFLLESGASVTSAADASGFRSIRQFNDTYREIFGETPTQTRKRGVRAGGSGPAGKNRGNLFLLKYRVDPGFKQILSFMRPRALAGVECVTEAEFRRTFRLRGARGWFSVTDNPEESALELSVYTDDIRCTMELCARVRKVFDLDTAFGDIEQRFAADPMLAPGLTDGRVPRLPAAFNPFEFAVRAILGQQVTVKAATTLAARIASKAGPPVRREEDEGADGSRSIDFPGGLERFFPAPAEILSADLGGLGITGRRQETIRTIARAVEENGVRLDPNQTLEEFSLDFSALKGIGPWTVNYTAMRGLGMIDAFPAADLGVIKAFELDGEKHTIREIEKAAESWRPYRTYAALCLWERLRKES